jgi:hypothetical protein
MSLTLLAFCLQGVLDWARWTGIYLLACALLQATVGTWFGRREAVVGLQRPEMRADRSVLAMLSTAAADGYLYRCLLLGALQQYVSGARALPPLRGSFSLSAMDCLKESSPGRAQHSGCRWVPVLLPADWRAAAVCLGCALPCSLGIRVSCIQESPCCGSNSTYSMCCSRQLPVPLPAPWVAAASCFQRIVLMRL